MTRGVGSPRSWKRQEIPLLKPPALPTHFGLLPFRSRARQLSPAPCPQGGHLQEERGKGRPGPLL